MKSNKQCGFAVFGLLALIVLAGTGGAVITATNQDVENAVEKIVPDQPTALKAAE